MRRCIEALTRAELIDATFVLSGIGSLSRVAVRYAGAEHAVVQTGDFEILSLAGTVSMAGAHLHGAFSDSEGRVFGGHIDAGCVVRTTAEILLGVLRGWSFGRRFDPATGYRELEIIPPGS